MSANLTTKRNIQFDSDLANFHLLVLVLSLFSSLRDVYANFKFIPFVFSTCRFVWEKYSSNKKNNSVVIVIKKVYFKQVIIF